MRETPAPSMTYLIYQRDFLMDPEYVKYLEERRMRNEARKRKKALREKEKALSEKEKMKERFEGKYKSSFEEKTEESKEGREEKNESLDKEVEEKKNCERKELVKENNEIFVVKTESFERKEEKRFKLEEEVGEQKAKLFLDNPLIYYAGLDLRTNPFEEGEHDVILNSLSMWKESYKHFIICVKTSSLLFCTLRCLITSYLSSICKVHGIRVFRFEEIAHKELDWLHQSEQIFFNYNWPINSLPPNNSRHLSFNAGAISLSSRKWVQLVHCMRNSNL